MTKDYYEILGVQKNADKAEIKKAFREKAKKHHPDKGGDEAVFKKINEAYEVLSDDQKRTQYDRFGSAGPQGFGGGTSSSGFGGFDFSNFGNGNVNFSTEGFGGFEDVFSSFFGGSTSNASSQKKSASRGEDLEVDIDISFEEAIKGTTKIFSAKRFKSCEDCHGKGGEREKPCEVCHGKGKVSKHFQTPFGTIAQQVLCEKCHGSGKEFENICRKCHGEGRYKEKTKIEIKIPAGVENNTTLRFREYGDAGKNGSIAGDLYAHIHVENSKKFGRKGLDIFSSLEISVFEAIGGAKKEVETFWGKIILNIPEGTREGQRLRIRDYGVKQSGQIGDHLVEIRYRMPKKISATLKKLLESAEKEATY